MNKTFTALTKRIKKSACEGPSEDTLLKLRLFARCFMQTDNPSEDRWFDKHTLSGKAI